MRSYFSRVKFTGLSLAVVLLCYAVCGVIIALVCLIGGVQLIGFSGATWLALVAMTIGPQLLGHSLINYALERVSATTVAVVLLLEVPGAALIAFVFLGQLPPARSVPGLALLMIGVAVVVLGAYPRRRSSPPSQPTNGGITISPDAIGTT